MQNITEKTIPEFQETTNESFLWGKLYNPAFPKDIKKPGIRTVLFGSTSAGILVLKHLSLFEKIFPDKLNLVGVATDDPVDPKARISAKKRIWSHYTPEEKEILFNQFLHTSMLSGISCYSGAVKTPVFRNLMSEWNPEVIIICCFGQKVDEFIYNYPVYGAYNFHPSDLRKKIGAGAKPFTDTIKNESLVSNMSLHIVTEEIDAGPVIATSPPINICLSNGSYPSSILTLQEKIPSVCGWMAIELILTILYQKKNGGTGPVSSIDFEKNMPTVVKGKLMQPASNDLSADYSIPVHFIISQKL